MGAHFHLPAEERISDFVHAFCAKKCLFSLAFRIFVAFTFVAVTFIRNQPRMKLLMDGKTLAFTLLLSSERAGVKKRFECVQKK